MIFLSTAYFPNILYFSMIIKHDSVFIEACENYIKQTFRNRCQILTANGVMNLVVPVVDANGRNIKDVKICYNENWRHRHLIAIKSAYGSAPFFEFYFDFINKILQQKFTFLWDLNFEILREVAALIPFEIEKINFTQFYQKQLENDYRYLLSPKKVIETSFKPYIQVFCDRFKFVPNLSIIDLMMNVGPDAKNYLFNNVG